MAATEIVDTTLIVIFLIGAVTGLVKGLIRQVVELAGFVLALFASVLFAGLVAEWLQQHSSIPYSPAVVIGFIVIFVGGLIAFHFAAMAIQKLVHMTFLGWVDRLCGAALGLIVAFLLCSMLVSISLELPLSRDVRRAVATSTLSNFVQPMAPWLFDAVFHHGDGGVSFESIFRRGETV